MMFEATGKRVNPSNDNESSWPVNTGRLELMFELLIFKDNIA